MNPIIYIFKSDSTVCTITKSILFFLITIFILTYFLNIDFVPIPYYGCYVMFTPQVSTYILYLKAFVCILNSDFAIYATVDA